jgi:hypothetical protein
MDHNMIWILSIINLMVVLLILLLLFVSASYVDRSRAKHKPSFGGRNVGTISDKFQQGVRLDQLVRDIAGLEQLLKPIVELTQKHERILSGAQSKGALGEQLVAERLADLPQEWYDRNVPFPGGAIVEFALRAPNKRWVPIDSQWTATRLLDQLGRASDQLHRNAFRAQVQAEVMRRAKEARKYVDKDCTLGFCIVAVPDPVFELSVDIQAKLTSSDIVLISYSLLVPYILLIVNQYLRTSQSTEALRISHIVSRFASQIEVIQKYINKEVIPPLDTVGLQQTQHGRRNRGLDHVHASVNAIQADLNEIQSALNVLKNMVNPIPNTDIDSIPKNLLRYLNLVRAGLLEGIVKQNGENLDSTDK